MKAFDFTDQQRRALLECGLSTAQVDAVEGVIPRCRSELRREPRVADVRTALDALNKSLQAALAALEPHLGSRGADLQDHSAAVLRALDRALRGTTIEDEIGRLYGLQGAVERAMKALPADQTRHRTAQRWWPLKLIHEAILGAGPAPYERPTNYEGGTFMSIASICYSAMLLVDDMSPSAAVRAFVKHLSETGRS